jgi:hypothetical protein
MIERLRSFSHFISLVTAIAEEVTYASATSRFYFD